MLILRIILFPISLLYGTVLAIRNLFFNVGIYSVKKVDAKVISVGNLSVGGTGKTPHVEFLIQQLSKDFKTAVLSRGYGRNTKGFLNVTANSKAENTGDEAINYARKFGENVAVAVCEKRVEGAHKIIENKPNIELIVLDDAFQHRYIYRDFNILLTEYSRPFFHDFVVPSGRLREFANGKNRADMVVVTKSPASLTSKEKEQFIQKLKMKPHIEVFFSSIVYGALVGLNGEALKETPKQVVLVTGIGNPTPLIQQLEKDFMVTHVEFKDHHNYTLKDIQKIHKLFDNLAAADKIVVTTEKDAVRLINSDLKSIIERYPWYIQEMTIEIDKKKRFLSKIYGIIKAN